MTCTHTEVIQITLAAFLIKEAAICSSGGYVSEKVTEI